MAKTIKSIQCPKCGSTQKTEVRTDLYRCDNCNTEYFLDNDDINVNIRQIPGMTPLPAAPAAKSRTVAVVAGAAVLGVFLLRLLFGHSERVYVPVPVAGGAVVAGSADEQPTDKYSWSSTREHLYRGAAGQPVLLLVGTRRYDGRRNDSCFATFLNARTGAELKSTPLPRPAGASSPDFAVQQFSNGDLYVFVNKATVYRVDPAAYELKDVSQGLFQGQPALSSGVASVEPGYDDNGDGLRLFTNDGRHLLFYPLIRQVYTPDAFYAARSGLQTLRPGSPTRTAFAFTSKSTTYPDERIQLIRYQYRDNGAGPKDEPNFSWDDDYGGSGIFTDADPHVKRLITPYELKEARVLSFSDFTPGRLYFGAAVLHADADQVLLTFRPTAADNSPRAVQCLNARTGAIAFTTPLPADFAPDQAVRCADGFALRDGRQVLTLSVAGSLRKTVALP